MIFKKNILLLLVFCLGLVFAQAQREFDFRISTVMYDDAERPCITVVMTPETKEIKKAWEDFVKKEYDIKLKGRGFLVNKDVLSAEKVVVKKLSDKEIDFRTRIVEEGDYSKMQIFVSLGYDIYLSPEKYPVAFEDLKSKTWKFLDQFLTSHYKEKVSMVRDELKDLTDDQEDLQDDIADNEKEIEKLRRENDKMRQELRMLENKIKDQRVELERQEKARRTFEREFISKKNI